MANFKVGQRVRIIGYTHDAAAVGREATILSPLEFVPRPRGEPPYWGHRIDIDGYGRYSLTRGHLLCARPEHLAPLEPEDSAWAADAVRKVTKPQHVEPVAPLREYAESGEREI